MKVAQHTKNGAVRDVLVVENLSINDIVPVIMNDSSENLKYNSARVIQQTATVWMQTSHTSAVKPSDCQKSTYSYVPKQNGVLATSPSAQDVTAFSLETTHGTRVASSFIKPKPCQK